MRGSVADDAFGKVCSPNQSLGLPKCFGGLKLYQKSLGSIIRSNAWVKSFYAGYLEP